MATTETFLGPVDNPCADNVWPTNDARFDRIRHFSGFTFNPVSSMTQSASQVHPTSFLLTDCTKKMDCNTKQ